MNHATLLSSGNVSLTIKSVAEAEIALKELKLQKKALQVQKKEIAEEIRCIRVAHTDVNLRRGSKMQGGGWLGRVVRLWQTAERDTHRYSLATKIAPYEERKQLLEKSLISIDKALLIVQNYVAHSP